MSTLNDSSHVRIYCVHIYVYTNFSIITALEAHRADRKKRAEASDSRDDLFKQQAESVESMDWEIFWGEESPKLLLYVCLHGTVEIVKYLLSIHVSPTTRYIEYFFLVSRTKLALSWSLHKLFISCTQTR